MSSVLNKTATQLDELLSIPPPDDLSPFISQFVCRSETVDGGAVRLLPELRASVQLTLNDPYWIREREENAPWQRCPRLALWMPRTISGYGYVASRVGVYAFGLKPRGLHTILSRGAKIACNTIIDLTQQPILSEVAAQVSDRDFELWVSNTSRTLRKLFKNVDPKPDIPDDVIARLATDGNGAIAAAADIMQLSARQFRRRFCASYGMPPKEYQRLLRVDRMLRQLHPRPWEPDSYGKQPIAFADQPHAIREFRRATGVTPTLYVAQKRTSDRTLRSLPAGPEIQPPGSPVHSR